MIPCAIGTDTGGSVRLPAAFCGIVGLKTTEGLLPTNGIVPLSHTLDTPGPMARTVTDVALMYEALCSEPVNLDLSAEIAGIRIGSLSDEERIGIEAEQLGAYDRSLDQLSDLGAEIIQFQPAKPFEEMKEAAAVILTAEGYFHHGALMDDPDSLVDENVRPRFKAGADISSAQYVGALLQRDSDRESFSLAMQGIDALVTPTTPMLPPPLTKTDELSTPARFTRAINYLSMCGTSVPSGISNEGLPTSLQIACAGGNEAICLQISAAYERARGVLPAPPLFAEEPGHLT
jgi:aspartyl-tRNA(Asn)/glutamyl-tRNA(Gln) amidotransferase subunit A